MGQNYNRQKGDIDAKVLRENEAVRKAHEAWTDVIFKHQSEYYTQRQLHLITSNSIRSKPADFFPVWEEWAPEAKQLYDQLIAAIPFTHGLD
jgi:hypothetical protein